MILKELFKHAIGNYSKDTSCKDSSVRSIQYPKYLCSSLTHLRIHEYCLSEILYSTKFLDNLYILWMKCMIDYVCWVCLSMFFFRFWVIRLKYVRPNGSLGRTSHLTEGVKNEELIYELWMNNYIPE